MQELVALAKASPGKLNYASLGIGFGQLSSERLFRLGLGLVRLLPIDAAWTIQLVAEPVIAALGTALYARALGLRHPSRP